jgi:F-type H+-transporting ATPase subunit gamma
MPEQMRDIKRRIRSVESTEQITKAMEMVAAVQLRRLQEKVSEARPYSNEIRELASRLVRAVDYTNHPLLVPRKGTRACYVVFTSDRGMCGGFNGHVLREATLVLKNESDADLVVIGRKGRDYFRRRNVNTVADFIEVGDQPGLEKARQIARTLLQLYEEGKADQIDLIYTEFISTSRQRSALKRLLPVEISTGEDDAGKYLPDYIYEPNPERVLDLLLPRFIIAQVYRAMFEAKASEHAARMLSMGSATKNAGEIITDLNLTYNKARQTAITKELTEIVGGAEALKG